MAKKRRYESRVERRALRRTRHRKKAALRKHRTGR